MGPSLTERKFQGFPLFDASALSGRIKIYGGVFRECGEVIYFSYPDDSCRLELMRLKIRKTIEPYFTVVDVLIVDYRGLDPLAGPGILVPLGESTLVIGAWPERNCADIFLHYCGDDVSDTRAQNCVEALRILFQAKKFERSALTLTPKHFVTV